MNASRGARHLPSMDWVVGRPGGKDFCYTERHKGLLVLEVLLLFVVFLFNLWRRRVAVEEILEGSAKRRQLVALLLGDGVPEVPVDRAQRRAVGADALRPRRLNPLAALGITGGLVQGDGGIE